jgi:acetyltransferase-like isoleucine patch superfamily enzyme
MLDGVSLVPSGGRVTIYITGNISLGNNVVLGSHPGTNMRFVMKSDASLLSTNPADQATFEAGNNFRFYGGLYGRNANVRIGTDSQIYGSIIGRTVHLRPRTQLHHDLAMLRSEICGAPKYAVRLGTWREVIP